MKYERSCNFSWLLIALLLLTITVKADKDLGKLVSQAQQLRNIIGPSKRLRLVHTSGRRFSQSSSGIVIAAGGADQLANALATVKVIRQKLKCKLPVEVIYYGSEEADPPYITALEAIADVSTKDAEQLAKLDKQVNCEVPGYLRKIFAVYYCSFAQLLYLDADNTPLVDPTGLFEWPEFKTWGNIFWPDYMGSGRFESAKPEIYNAFGLKPPWDAQPNWKCTESGQFLLDRRKHADVMEWVLFLNKEHEITYKYMYGDKDTFELAFSLAGKADSFYKINYGPRPSFRPIERAGDFSHTGMLQTDTSGHPVFFHQVAGGKFYLDKAGLAVPIFTSLGMTGPALDRMYWDKDIGTLRLPVDNSVAPHNIQCRHFDGPTARLFHDMNSTRWDTCGTMANSRGYPFPLLPLVSLPAYILETISALLQQFHSIQRDRYLQGRVEPML